MNFLKESFMNKTKATHRPPRNKKPIRPPAMNTIGNVFKAVTEKFNETAENLLASRPADTVSAIKADHDALRNFIGTLKDADAKISERKAAYKQFAELLKSHTIAEENAVYRTSVRLTGHKMHVKITEGYVEHLMADDLMKRIARTKKPLEWTAHVNVLAEIVEHHLKEEEDDLLPLIRKEAKPKVDQKMLVEYMKIRAKTHRPTTPKNAGVLKSKSSGTRH
jgi:iron-sulfur cluster repair protein YtfE (RIC family)